LKKADFFILVASRRAFDFSQGAVALRAVAASPSTT
jgi:hypothetical protein